jgi:hypothetical protein
MFSIVFSLFQLRVQICDAVSNALLDLIIESAAELSDHGRQVPPEDVLDQVFEMFPGTDHDDPHLRMLSRRPRSNARLM